MHGMLVRKLRVVQGGYYHARPLHHPKAETLATVHHPNLLSSSLYISVLTSKHIDLPALLVFTTTAQLQIPPQCEVVPEAGQGPSGSVSILAPAKTPTLQLTIWCFLRFLD